MKIQNKHLCLPVVAALVTSIAIVACSSSDSENRGPGPADSTAAAVAGEPDTHCGTRSVAVDPAACNPEHEDDHHDDHAADAGAAGDGGEDDHDHDGGATQPEHADTLFNSEGDDEDCKYHVKWTSSAVRPNEDVNLQAVITTKADGKPVVGAPVSAEIFLDETHPAPNSGAKTTETAPGTYLIGPVRFDASGQWTVRFHIHGDCSGHGEASPHGHVAFFAKVP